MKMNEAISDIAQDARLLVWVEQVKHSCSDYLQSLAAINYSNFLYRGILHTNGSFGDHPIRQDRKTLTTFDGSDKLGTELYNYFAEQQFNIQDLRSKVAFTSSALLHAKSFGEVCAIIPVDGSQYFYTEGVEDSISQRIGFVGLFAETVISGYKELFTVLYGDVSTNVLYTNTDPIFKYLNTPGNEKVKQEIFQATYESYLDSDSRKIESLSGTHIMEEVQIEQNLEVLVYSTKMKYYYITVQFMDKLSFSQHGVPANGDVRASVAWFFQRYFG